MSESLTLPVLTKGRPKELEQRIWVTESEGECVIMGHRRILSALEGARVTGGEWSAGVHPCEQPGSRNG